MAMAEIVSKRGYRGTTVEHIVRRAKVARATFYENFENREACLLASFDESVLELRRRTAAAYAAEAEWPDQIRAGLAAFLAQVVSQPALARTCLVEAVTAGPIALQRYEQALQSFTPAFRPGRGQLDDAGNLPETLEDSIVGGVVWMVHQRLLRNELDQIPTLLPTMVEFALAPYLGEQRAVAAAAAC